MPVYLISDVSVRDAEVFQTYRTRAASITHYRQFAAGGPLYDVQPINARIFARTSASSDGDIVPLRLARLLRQSRLLT